MSVKNVPQNNAELRQMAFPFQEMELWEKLFDVSLEFDIEISGGQSNQAQGFMQMEIEQIQADLAQYGYSKEIQNFYIGAYLEIMGRGK